MANGIAANNQEHGGLAPEQYSNRQEIEEYNALRTSSPIENQTYLQSSYSGVEYKNYAGIVVISPPNPIVIPSRQRYDGIAPMRLQPSINPPYPYDPHQWMAY